MGNDGRKVDLRDEKTRTGSASYGLGHEISVIRCEADL